MFTIHDLGLLSMGTSICQTYFSLRVVPGCGGKLGPRKMLTLGLCGAFVCAGTMALSTWQLYVHVGAYLGMMAAVLVGVIGNRSQLQNISQSTGLGSGALGSMSRLAMTLGQVSSRPTSKGTKAADRSTSPRSTLLRHPLTPPLYPRPPVTRS